MKTAAIYARYSSDRQTEQSIEGQIRVCQEYAERNDIHIIETYIDRAMTGTNDNREAFQQMMKDSDKKAWEYVLVYKLDRFSRNKFEMAIHRKHLKDNGIKILSAMENIPDTPEGILLEGLLEAMNQYYSEELAQKTRRGQKETRLKGLYSGGKLNYGYYAEKVSADSKKKKICINEEEAAVVREIFECYAAGERGNEIAIEFVKRGILYRGKPFSAANIYVILHGEKYTGKYDLHGEIYNDVYPQIISPDLYETCRQKIDANRYGNHVPDYSYLLRRRVYCGECGTRMTSYSGTSRSGRVNKYYKCWNAIGKRNCQAKFIKKDVLDELVKKALFEYLITYKLSEVVEDIYRRQREQLSGAKYINFMTKELAAVNKSIKNILDAIERGVTSETVNLRLIELEHTRAHLQNQIEQESTNGNEILSPKNIEEKVPKIFEENPQYWVDRYIEKVIVSSDSIKILFSDGASKDIKR